MLDPARRSDHTWQLIFLFCLEYLVLELLRIPELMSLDFWAFMDQGANLTIQHLLNQGYRPTLDFGYHYGLLPLLISKLWLSATGIGTVAYLTLSIVTSTLVAAGMARVASATKMGLAGIALIIAAMPFAVYFGYPNLAHALEAAAICNGVAEQAAGRRRVAIAMGIIALLSKPTAGFLYVVVVAAFELRDLRERGTLNLSFISRAARPGLFLFVVLILILGLAFGCRPLMNSLMPLTGVRAYRAQHFGFFSAGRPFWYFPGVRIGYYVGTTTGFWLAATFWLLLTGISATVRSLPGDKNTSHARADEIVATCMIMHLAFVFLFWGNSSSWFYYSYLLVLGCAETAAWNDSRRMVPWFLAAIIAFEQRGPVRVIASSWTATRPSLITGGLWASDEEREEWKHITELIKNEHLATGMAYFLARSGGAAVLFSEFEPPVSAYLDAALPTDSEWRRVNGRIEAAQIIVTVVGDPTVAAPELRTALSSFELIFNGKHFAVYRRNGVSHQQETSADRARTPRSGPMKGAAHELL